MIRWGLDSKGNGSQVLFSLRLYLLLRHHDSFPASRCVTKILKMLFNLENTKFVFAFADAKGIRVGGIKVKPPKASVPKVSLPKPRVPIIVPIVAPVPIVGTTYYGRNNRNNRRSTKKAIDNDWPFDIFFNYLSIDQLDVQCYSCEGRDNDPCVLNPAALNGKIVTCSQNQYCSIIRREIPSQSTGTVIAF